MLIYELIGKAMAEIGAIGKDSYNSQQKFKYRGVDAVMNALNPVLQKYGLFVTPEVLSQVREERQTNNGGRLLYSILTMKYTMFAPDGSNVSSVVIGEGMDSGDKASNKAMSVAFKYAMFQLFCIPTEEFIDPDSETPPPSKPTQPPAHVNASEPQQQKINTTYGSQPEAQEDPKAKYLKTLKQNALFAYGNKSEEKLNEMLQAQGVTMETMTGVAFKAINKQIYADIAANNKKEGE